MQSIYTYLVKWNKATDSLAKIQGAYLVLAIAAFITAGVISLIHPPLGHSVLFLAFVFGLTFIGNGVIWSLIRTFVSPKLEKPKTSTIRNK